MQTKNWPAFSKQLDKRFEQLEQIDNEQKQRIANAFALLRQSIQTGDRAESLSLANEIEQSISFFTGA